MRIKVNIIFPPEITADWLPVAVLGLSTNIAKIAFDIFLKILKNSKYLGKPSKYLFLDVKNTQIYKNLNIFLAVTGVEEDDSGASMLPTSAFFEMASLGL